MHARSTTIEGQPSSIDAAIAHMRDSVMPALEGIDRCVGLSVLVDRTSGRGVASATFDSIEAMEPNKDKLDRIRATGSQEARAEVLDECDFELALAHLRVPCRVANPASGGQGAGFRGCRRR